MWEEVGRGQALLAAWKATKCSCSEDTIFRCKEQGAKFEYYQWWQRHGEAVLVDYIEVEKSLRDTAVDALSVDTENYELLAENKKLKAGCMCEMNCGQRDCVSW